MEIFRENYTLEGWYTAAEGGTEVTPETSVTAITNHTLYAHWIPVSYTVTLETNGGIINSGEVTGYTYGEAVALPTNVTKPGYTFDGWYVSENFNGGRVTGISDTDSGAKVFYAKWNVVTYNITYHLDGGANASGNPAIYTIEEETITLQAPTRTGYTFAGWYTAENDGGAEVSEIAKGSTGNVVLYAKWTAKTYTVTLNTNGGAITDGNVSGYTYGEGATLPVANQMTKVGHTFAGWYDNESCTGKAVTAIGATDTGEKTYYAKWTKNIYKIKLIDGESVEETAYTYGVETRLPTAAEKTKEGYTFAGWYDNEKLSGTAVKSIGATDTGDKTYYAKWTINHYIITWIVDDKTVKTETPEYGKAVAVPENPSKTGYDFVGWEAVDETGKTVAVPETMPACNVTITAKWKVRNYTIQLNVGGGELSGITSVNKNYGDTYGTLPEPTRTGYAFNNWTVGGEKVESTTMVQSNAELVATWTPNKYTVTFHVGAGSLPEEEKTATVTYDSAYGDLPEPTRTGYTFLGWYTTAQREAALLEEGEDSGKITKDTVMTTAGDHTLYAHWKINTYTITFVVGEGVDAMASITAAYGSIINVANPTKTGYRFVEWKGDDGKTYASVPTTMPATDLTLTAEWAINQYTITFATDGGTEIAPITQNYGTKVTAPANPTKVGYTFDGWDKTIPTSMPAENVTITARWTVNSYTIRFDAKEGAAVEAITANYGTTVAAPVSTREGYAFGGWYTDAECAENTKYSFSTMPAENITLYAKWIPGEVNYDVEHYLQDPNGTTYPTIANKTVTMTGKSGETTAAEALVFEGFTAAGFEQTTISGDGTTRVKIYYTRNKHTVTFVSEGTTFATLEFYYGAEIAAPGGVPTKTGHTFANWGIPENATMPDSDVTYTAAWTANIYGVRLNANGGTVNSGDVKNYTYGVGATLPTDVTRTGYDFGGWYAAENFRGEAVTVITAADLEAKVFYAKWTPSNYEVTLVTNNGTINGGTVTGYTYGVGAELPADVTREGYTFKGWFEAADFSGEPAAEIGADETGDKTFYAKWQINRYKLTWDAAGGTIGEASYSHGDVCFNTTLTAPEVTRTGYTFAGWDKEIPATMPACDVTITAVWTINSYKVFWVVDGVTTEESYEYGGVITKYEDPSKTGYTFTGWSDYEENATMPAHDVTYTATWRANTYGVTLYTNGGNVNFGIVNEYTYGAGATLPVDVTRTGYTFDGWYEEEDFSGDKVTAIGKTDLGIKTFYAKWRANTYKVTLVTNGGTVNKENVTEYTYGAGATLPTDVTRTGYTFAGWYAGKDLSGDPVASITKTDIEAKMFYAKWTANTDTAYTVKHYLENADGSWPDEAADTTPMTGTTGQLTAAEAKTYEGYTAGTIENLTIAADGSTVVKIRYTRNSYPLTVDGVTVAEYKHGAAIPAVEDLVKDHYIFAGWEESLPETMPIGGFALTSTWTPVEYAITYDLNNGEMDLEAAPATYTIESETFTLPVPTRTGYTFTGWTGSNGSEKQTEVEVVKGTTGVLTYKANWSNNQYTVKFNANGGAGEMEDAQYKYDVSYGLYLNGFTYIGHTFSGWNTKSDGTGDAYPNGANVKNLATGGEVILYAQWTANKYTVTFHANGGSGSMDGFEVTYGEAGQTVPGCAFTRPGYTFDGWKDGSGSSYAVGADLSAITINLLLFAQWKPNSYLVTFAPGEGGSGTMESQSFVYGVSQALNTNQFTREGYEFVGWKRENGTIYKDGEVVSNLSTGEPVVLTAQWKIRAFTITYDADGGTGVISGVTQNYSTQVSDPGVPEKPGWRFDGWYDGDAQVEFPITMPAGDKTITARWTSYLSLLIGIVPENFSERLEEERHYYSQLVLDPEQVSDYQDEYTEHKEAFFAAIKVVATAELRESVERDETILNVNKMLYDQGKTPPTPFAELELLDAAAGKVAVWIHDGAYPATNLLTVNFLPALFNSPDIKTVTFPELIGKTNATGDSIDTCGIYQMDLMLHAAYIGLADRAKAEGFEGYDAFVPWLKENMDIAIGAMDGASVQVRLNAETPEGVQYDVTYTLYFNNVHHDVIWDLGYELNGEAQKIIQTYAMDDVIVAPKDPVREGYTFSRWDGFVADTVMELADVTYTAIWTAVEYGISYNLAGGAATNPGTYTVESDTITLESPTRIGYIFDGWTGEGVTEPTRGLTIPAGSTGDKAFIAHWTPITYIITYDLAGGALGEGKNNPVEYTVEDSFALVNPTREGYTFKGWTTGKTGEVPQLEVTVDKGTTGDLNYVANWTENNYTVRFDANGGAVSPAEMTVQFGSPYGSLPIPTRTGYTFNGWFTAAAGGEQVKTTDIVPSLPDEFTLYAQWTANEYTVAFDANGGSVETGAKDVTFGSAYGELPEPVLKGHTFQGWLLNGEPVTADMVVAVAGNHTLVAQWAAETYIITLKHGDEADTATTITVTYGKTYAEGGLASLTREGYGFNGWFTAAEGGAQVRPGDTVSVLEAGTTLYAQWTLGAFGITYVNSDGSGETITSNPSSYTVESADIVLADPVRTGYTFLGWTGEGVTEPVKGLTIPAGSTGDKTFTAHWTMDTYTVTYDLDGGTGAHNPDSYTVVSDTFTLVNPTRAGYTFLGWSGTGLNGMSMMVAVEQGSAGNRSYTANWQINKYSITYYVDGKLYDTVPDVAFGTELAAIAQPTKTGHTFSGWQGLPATMPDSDVEVTGTFTANTYTVVFDGNGATGGVMADQIFTYGVPQKLTANTYRRTGYTFDGWYCGTAILTDGSEVENLAAGGTITLTAKWTPNKNTAYTVNHYWQNADDPKYVLKDSETLYGTTGSAVTPVSRIYLGFKRPAEQTITIKADGSTVVEYYYDRQTFSLTWNTGDDQAVLSLRYGAAIVPREDPVREGYTFTGWDQTIPGTMPAEDLTITARWEENTYSIIYIVDGETHKTVARNYGAAIALEAEPTRTGYTFSGWSEAPAAMPAHDVTISGIFTANQYQVSYDPNYSGAAPIDGKTVTYDGAYGTLAIPTRTGYGFDGWTLDGEKVGADTVVKTADAHTLVAQWTANTYTVTLDAGEGTVDRTSVSVAYDSAYELPTPVRAGYNFGGWYRGDVQIAREGVYTFTSDLKLEAEWSEAGDTPYTVEYYLENLNGKGYTLYDTEEFTGATNAPVRAEQPARDGFTVNAEESVLTGTIAGDGSLVLKVYYDRDSYTVTWIVPGSTVTQTYLYGQPLNVPATEWQDVNARYDFTGWNVALPETVTGSATYTAVYDTYYEVAVVNTAGETLSTYRTLEVALKEAAKASGKLTLRMEVDRVLTEDLAVPANVTLVLPCIGEHWACPKCNYAVPGGDTAPTCNICKDKPVAVKRWDGGYVNYQSGLVRIDFNQNGTSTAGKVGVGPDAYLYRELTVAEGATLTVNGTVMVNAVTGRPSGGHMDMDVTGGYAQINLYGDIVVNNGGTLDCFGYIKGDGLVTARKGGTVGDLYIVRNWRGGSQAEKMFNAKVYPMTETDCHNIEATIRIEYGASYVGLVKMNANNGSGNKYYSTRFPQVDVNNGLIRLKSEDGCVIRSYDHKTKRDTYEIYGGADFANSSLFIVLEDISTANFTYPIDGDMDFILADGDYTFVNDYKIMTGATFTVKGDATLTIAKYAINENLKMRPVPDDGLVTVVFYTDEFRDKPNTDGTAYPDRPTATLTLEEGAVFTNAGIFAGTIYTSEDNVFVEPGPAWEVTTREADGYFNAVNAPYVVELNFDLDIHREGYIWRFGEAARGEEEGSIVWIKDGSYGVSINGVESAEDGIQVSAEVYNTTHTDVTCTLFVAAYDASGRMLAVEIIPDYAIPFGYGNAVTDLVTLEFNGTATTVRAFIMDESYVPLAPAASMSKR